MKKPFEVGDRVAVYGAVNENMNAVIYATITDFSKHAPPLVFIDIDQSCYDKINKAVRDETKSDESWEPLIQVNPKQCRRLVKKKRREIWVDLNYYTQNLISSRVWSDAKQDGWTRFIEAKEKK